MGRRATPRQETYQVQRRVIAPVEIFKDEDQWRLGCERLEHFGKLAQHALPRGPLQLLLQLLPVCRRQQPRHLHQPGRGLLAQQGPQARPRWAATELSQGLQDG